MFYRNNVYLCIRKIKEKEYEYIVYTYFAMRSDYSIGEANGKWGVCVNVGTIK